MEFFEVIKKRRSVRKFTPQPVENEKIRRALDAALLAPNSSNMQPWEFYWVRAPEKKAQLVEACLGQNAAATAQELIVSVARRDTWRRNRSLILDWIHNMPNPPKALADYYEKLIPVAYAQDPLRVFGLLRWLGTTVVGLFRPIPRAKIGRSSQFEMIAKTTALACENLMLALVAQGLGCCPMEGFDEVRVKGILGLNRHCHVVMVIGAGYAAADGIYTEQFRIPASLVIKEV